MIFAAALTSALLASAQPSIGTTVAQCMHDAPRTLDEVEGRNAWAKRCAPRAPEVYGGRYPLGSFASFVGSTNAVRADDACPDTPPRAVVRCHVEGLLGGQRVLTEQGYVSVDSLLAQGVQYVASWDSTKACPSALPMSRLTAVVRRSYKGPVILIETDLGALLDVTAGQPILKRSGKLVRADALGLGDVLLSFDGLHHVERLSQTDRTTDVYQIHVAEGDFDHNAVFAEDLFTTTARLAEQIRPRATP